MFPTLHKRLSYDAAEKDKQYFEEKLTANSVGLDSLNKQINSLSLKLEAAEETTVKCKLSHLIQFVLYVFNHVKLVILFSLC